MTQRFVQHATFTVERDIEHAPEKVFTAFADPKAKQLWFGNSEGLTIDTAKYEFRIGGQERVKGTWTSGMVSDFNSRYYDIVPNERIVYAYEMHINGKIISVSLATIEFQKRDKGTHLIVTEQGSYLDYDDAGNRKRGTEQLMDTMISTLSRQ